MRRIGVPVCGVLALGILAALFWTQTRRTRPPSAPSKQNLYAGSHACAQCHPGVEQQFRMTGMGRSWQTVDATSRLFRTQLATVTHSPSGWVYRAFADAQGAWIEQAREAQIGSPANRRVYPVRFAIGSGNRGSALAVEHNGYLNLGPINWYAESDAWDMNPGYERHNWQFERPVLPRCTECHNGRADYVSGSSNRYRLPIEQGIGCEQCHGPGARHVALHRSRERRDQPAGSADQTIVNPARLDPARQNDVCFQCHLSSDVEWNRAGTGSVFLPGELLADYRVNFLADPADPDAVGVSSHAVRMVQSRCFQQSGGRMTCLSCHEVHGSTERTSAASRDASCLDCHKMDQCPTVKSSETGGRGCAQCHMPSGPASNAPHVTYTDHWIRTRPPLFRPELHGTVKAKRNDGKPAILKKFGIHPATPQELGMAYVAYFHQQPDDRSAADLSHGVKLLEQVMHGGSSLAPAARYWLGIAYGHVGRWSDAVRQLDRSVPQLTAPDLAADGLLRQAQALTHSGQSDRAVQVYEELIERFPENMAGYHGLIPLLMQQNKPDRAGQLCRRGLELRADDAVLLANLAYAELRQFGPGEQVRDLLDRAEKLNPDLALVFFARAAVAQAAGEGAESVRFQRDALCAMARAALSAGYREEAYRLLKQALESAPDDPELVRWLEQLGQAPD